MTTPTLFERVRDHAHDYGTDPDSRAAFLRRHRFEVDVVDADAVSAAFDRVQRYSEMRDDWAADLEAERVAYDAQRAAEHAAEVASLPAAREPERSSAYAQTALGRRDVLDGHALSPSERAALSAAAVTPDRPRTRRAGRR